MNYQTAIEINEIFQKLTVVTDPIERAQLINKVRLDYGLKTKDIAKRLNTRPTNISNLVRILRLPDLVLDGYYSDVISSTHLQIISRLNKIEDIIDVYEKVIHGDASAAKTEKLVFEKLYQSKPEGIKIAKETLQKLTAEVVNIHPDCRIELVQTQKKARLTIVIDGTRKKTTSLLEKLIERIIGNK